MPVPDRGRTTTRTSQGVRSTASAPYTSAPFTSALYQYSPSPQTTAAQGSLASSFPRGSSVDEILSRRNNPTGFTGLLDAEGGRGDIGKLLAALSEWIKAHMQDSGQLGLQQSSPWSQALIRTRF